MGMQEFRVPQIRCSMHLVYFSAFRGQRIRKRVFNLLPLCVPQIRCEWQGLTA